MNLSGKISIYVGETFTKQKLLIKSVPLPQSDFLVIADKTYELHITATIGNNWHLYAQDAGEGPVHTQITFTANPLIKLDGKVKEVGKMEKSFDKNFNSTLKFYANKVDFVQKIKVKSAIATVIKGSVNYMVCNDKQCLPPKDVPFSIKVGGK